MLRMKITCLINGTTFEWDADKEKTNLNKHGIPFQEAAHVFFDPFFQVVDASRNDEARDAAIGYDQKSRMLFVVHMEIDGEVIRIISARKAEPWEREIYDS